VSGDIRPLQITQPTGFRRPDPQTSAQTVTTTTSSS